MRKKKEIDCSLLKNIKILMNDTKISTRMLQEMSVGNIDISQGSFSNVINGTQAITLKYIKFFCSLFCISPNVVLDVNDEEGVLVYDDKNKPYLISFSYYCTLRDNRLLLKNELVSKSRTCIYRVARKDDLDKAEEISKAKFLLSSNSLDKIYLPSDSNEAYIEAKETKL